MAKKIKILTINFGGIGDEILFFPTLKAIKDFYKDSELTLVTEPRSKSAKDLTLSVDKVIECDIKDKKNKNLNTLKLLTKIWAGQYDVVISSGGSKFVSVLLFLTGIKKRIGYDSGALSKILLTKAVPLNKNQYAVDMYHDLAKALNKNKKADLPEVYVSQESLTWVNNNLLRDDNKKIIVIHPGVSQLSIDKNIIKFWSSKNWLELIVKLLSTNEYKVVLTGGPDDKSILEEINSELENHSDIHKENLLNLYGKTKNLSQLAAVISKSDLLVCVDSAPMHVAVGVKTPVVAIFGPTDENKLLPPDNSQFIAVKNDDLACRPCLWDRRQISCDDCKCLTIDPDKVFQNVIKLGVNL